MIDPTDITKFDRTDAELEEWWLFSCVVAGKTATTQARLLDSFLLSLRRYHPANRPFKSLNQAVATEVLERFLRESRLGQYRRLTRCFAESLDLDLRHDPIERLEEVYGIGPKTARMFVMHSRPNQRVAAIDTHVLKHLAAHGHKVPTATPSSRKLYRELEQAFIDLADAAGQSVADYDLGVWKSYARA